MTTNHYQTQLAVDALHRLDEALACLETGGRCIGFSGTLTPTTTDLRLEFDRGDVVAVLADLCGLDCVTTAVHAKAHGPWMGGTLTLVGAVAGTTEPALPPLEGDDVEPVGASSSAAQ